MEVLAASGNSDELSVRIDTNTSWETAERAMRVFEAIEQPKT